MRSGSYNVLSMLETPCLARLDRLRLVFIGWVCVDGMCADVIAGKGGEETPVHRFLKTGSFSNLSNLQAQGDQVDSLGWHSTAQ